MEQSATATTKMANRFIKNFNWRPAPNGGATGRVTLSVNTWPSSGRARVRSFALILALLLVLIDARAIELSRPETERIGKKIWQNECNGTVSGLTSWNGGENVASLGIS